MAADHATVVLCFYQVKEVRLLAYILLQGVFLFVLQMWSVISKADLNFSLPIIPFTSSSAPSLMIICLSNSLSCLCCIAKYCTML